MSERNAPSALDPPTCIIKQKIEEQPPELRPLTTTTTTTTTTTSPIPQLQPQEELKKQKQEPTLNDTVIPPAKRQRLEGNTSEHMTSPNSAGINVYTTLSCTMV